MEIIQIILGVIITAIGINLFIVVNNLSKKRPEESDEEKTSYYNETDDQPAQSLLAKVLKIGGYTVAVIIMLAGVVYIVMQYFLNTH